MTAVLNLGPYRGWHTRAGNCAVKSSHFVKNVYNKTAWWSSGHSYIQQALESATNKDDMERSNQDQHEAVSHEPADQKRKKKEEDVGHDLRM